MSVPIAVPILPKDSLELVKEVLIECASMSRAKTEQRLLKTAWRYGIDSELIQAYRIMTLCVPTITVRLPRIVRAYLIGLSTDSDQFWYLYTKIAAHLFCNRSDRYIIHYLSAWVNRRVNSLII